MHVYMCSGRLYYCGAGPKSDVYMNDFSQYVFLCRSSEFMCVRACGCMWMALCMRMHVHMYAHL
jgi:hypothetical protein